MKRIFLYIIILAGWSQHGLCQEPMRLQDCLEVGLENNYSLQIVRNLEESAHNDVTWGNAGFLPTLDASASYQGALDNTDYTYRESGETLSQNGVYDQTMNVGLSLNWTLFDGFRILSNYKRLKELEQQGETNTRIAIEDYIANLTAAYYNLVQQKIRLKNLGYAVSLSKERLRIVEERYNIGNFSRLDLLQARVDFNADSATYMKQQEVLYSARIELNELMSNQNIDQYIVVSDSIINVNMLLHFEELWNATLMSNASLLKAEQNSTLAELDFKMISSRDYPYVRFSTGYGYTFNKYDVGTYERRGNLGLNAGLTVGFRIFDGNRKRERQNAQIVIDNARLQRQELELSLRADISNLWQAYRNNIELVYLERENLTAARENHEIAVERYMLGDLSGIEMREAQKSLLDAEERILTAEYDTKLCEISLLQISGMVTRYLQ
ncbi:MAG: TolC family protein [Bacteroides sp.]|nr:TolC family protein [Bacteroides sp.]